MAAGELPEGGAGADEGRNVVDASIQRILYLSLGLLAVAAAISLRFGWPFLWGVLAGGLLMVANLRIITGVIRAVFAEEGRKGWRMGLYWLKFAALLGLVTALILWVKVDGVGFVVGMSTFLAAVFVESGLRLLSRR